LKPLPDIHIGEAGVLKLLNNINSHKATGPDISLLNISVYRLQPRLFIDSPPYLKKNPKGP
jgi:hypothetical protein